MRYFIDELVKELCDAQNKPVKWCIGDNYKINVTMPKEEKSNMKNYTKNKKSSDVIKKFKPVKIRFYNNLVTKIWWDDNTTIKVICNSEDTFDKQTGVIMCTVKKLLGNTGHYNRELSHWIRDFGQEINN